MTANKTANKGTSALTEIPYDAIQDAMKVHPNVLLTVRRRNQKGELQTVIPGWTRPTVDLLDIEPWLLEIAGGGKFRIEPKNTERGVEPLFIVPPFNVSIEAPPKAVNAPAANAPVGVTPPGVTSWPGAAPNPIAGGAAWHAGLSPQDQQSYLAGVASMQPPFPYYPGGGAPRRASLDAADNLALRQVADLKEEMAKYREEAKAEREKREAEIKRAEEKLAEERRRSEELLALERRRFEEVMQRSREEAERERERQREREREDDRRRAEEERRAFEFRLTELKSSLERRPSMRDEIAPLLAELRGPDRSMELQIKMMEMSQANQAQLLAVLTQANKGDAPMLELFKEMLAQKSPEAQATLIQNMLEMQVTSIGAMAQLVKETAPEGLPVWAQVAMQGLGQIQNIAEDYMATMKSKNPAPVQLQRVPDARSMELPASFQTIELPAPTATASAPSAPELEVVSTAEVPANATPARVRYTAEELVAIAKAKAELATMAALLPASFRTPEWERILIELHAQLPASRVADLLARHLAWALEFGQLPRELGNLPQAPLETLAGVMGYLPIYRRAPEYLEQVVRTAVAFLAEEGYVAAPEGSESSDDDGGVVPDDYAPAPSPA